jgi:hypothetical protein
MLLPAWWADKGYGALGVDNGLFARPDAFNENHKVMRQGRMTTRDATHRQSASAPRTLLGLRFCYPYCSIVRDIPLLSARAVMIFDWVDGKNPGVPHPAHR